MLGPGWVGGVLSSLSLSVGSRITIFCIYIIIQWSLVQYEQEAREARSPASLIKGNKQQDDKDNWIELRVCPTFELFLAWHFFQKQFGFIVLFVTLETLF